MMHHQSTLTSTKWKQALILFLLSASSVGYAQSIDGKTAFGKKCAACHQADGRGIPGAFPALKGNTFVQGDETKVITTILKGRGGMPTFASSLDDDNLAIIVSYIREAWGNQSAPVSVAQVQALRQSSRAPQIVVQTQGGMVH